jgi:hypothetical protein
LVARKALSEARAALKSIIGTDLPGSGEFHLAGSGSGHPAGPACAWRFRILT